MAAYRFTLQPYKGWKTRFDCPSCGARRRFTRYIDTETGNYLDERVGRCDRVDSCGYHYTPKQFFEDNPLLGQSIELYRQVDVSPKPHTPKPVSYIPEDIFRQSLRRYSENHLVFYLTRRFGADVAQDLVSCYRIGTSSHWGGATVFWQVDVTGKVRTGKVMLYDPEKGKRIKEPFSHINWVHSVLQLSEFNLQQCLFGEHLLASEPTKTVAVVESEKTALIASVYLPQFVWLASGGLYNLSVEKCQVLKGRNVVLFPDVNSLEKWREKAQELSAVASVMVSEMLERGATAADRQQGIDLADYLVRFDVDMFR